MFFNPKERQIVEGVPEQMNNIFCLGQIPFSFLKKRDWV